MAKELVGVRVPVAIAEQVEQYAETYDISKTEAIDYLICVGYDRDLVEEDRHVRGPEPEHVDLRDADVGRSIRGKLKNAEPYEGDYTNTEAPTARLSNETVERIEDWQESQDMNRTNAAADLLERGLRIDPTPEEHEQPSVNNWVGTSLSPELYEVFRKYRLSWNNTKPEAVQSLAMPSSSREVITPDWGKP